MLQAEFSEGLLQGYIMRISQLEWELSWGPELAVAVENWESQQSKVIENNDKKGIRICKEDDACCSYSETYEILCKDIASEDWEP
jgi:hypothetical protein